MSDPQQYTVGWICAITTEYTAARQFLDEEHDRPDHASANDNNDYTLGKMAGHNVVIAVLPDGEYGLSSATAVAKDMLNSFPSVRVGLMVGIGGGVPTPKHDIRLGDVVVSSRQGETDVMRTAVSGLRSKYEDDGHQIEANIHGVIASANQLMKDAIIRDTIAKEKDVMCFEMEAAGLMNHFPCLVVRGICDYSDSHKSKEWQGYAAMTAAVYTKDLLTRMVPSRVEQEDRIRMILAEFLKISTNEQFKNINPDRVDQTCQWALSHPLYRRWRDSAADDLLWISADPGCGKSVLSKSLVDEELRSDADDSTVCYFF
ncbi:purine and uridine phosphorylase, partial [Aureobasidium melanogenum]